MYDALRATFDNPHCNVVQIIAVFLTGNSPSGLTSRKHKLLLVVFKNRSALPCGWALFLCVATDHRHLAVNHNGNMSQVRTSSCVSVTEGCKGIVTTF